MTLQGNGCLIGDIEVSYNRPRLFLFRTMLSMESKLLHTSIGVNENTDVWDYHMVPFLEEFTYLGSQVSQLTQSRICSLRYDTIYDLVKKHNIYLLSSML